MATGTKRERETDSNGQTKGSPSSVPKAIEAFRKFLALIHTEEEVAGDIFVEVYKKLVIFAEARDVVDPKAFADRIFELLPKRDRNEPINNLGGLAHSLARDVLKEARRQKAYAPASLSEVGIERSIKVNHLTERAALEILEKKDSCLSKCLNQLSAKDKFLIRSYYGDGKETQKLHEVRKQLADKCGFRRETLTVAIYRIHETLDPCVQNCVDS